MDQNSYLAYIRQNEHNSDLILYRVNICFIRNAFSCCLWVRRNWVGPAEEFVSLGKHVVIPHLLEQREYATNESLSGICYIWFRPMTGRQICSVQPQKAHWGNIGGGAGCWRWKNKMIKKWTNKLAALKDRVNIMAVEILGYTQPQKCITSNG